MGVPIPRMDGRSEMESASAREQAEPLSDRRGRPRDVFGGLGCAVVPALRERAAHRLEHLDLLGRLDPLGNDLHADALPELDDGLEEGTTFFRDIGDRKNLKAMLQRMAGLYERQGNDAEFRRVKKVLEKEFPGSSPTAAE